MAFDIYDNKFVQAIMDFRNFFKFRKEIGRELREPKSGMNSLGIKRNWLGNILYVQINCSDVDLRNADYDFDRMVMTKLKPIVQYLGQDLGWSDYLVPQVNNFVDENDNPSLSYGVLFVFTGYSLTLTKLLFTFLVTLGVIGGSIYAWLSFV
jgi:hypothetical protein